MTKYKGTPKHLIQAINRAVIKGTVQNRVPLIRDAVKDFLAQKFNLAIMQAPTQEEANRLMALFAVCTDNEAGLEHVSETIAPMVQAIEANHWGSAEFQEFWRTCPHLSWAEAMRKFATESGQDT